MTNRHFGDLLGTSYVRAHGLLQTGLDIAIRLRDDDPAAVRRSLDLIPDYDIRDITVLLAACIDIERRASTLMAWYTHPDGPPKTRRNLRPCGTYAAAQRHRLRREPLCMPCRDAERDYARDKRRAERARRHGGEEAA